MKRDAYVGIIPTFVYTLAAAVVAVLVKMEDQQGKRESETACITLAK